MRDLSRRQRAILAFIEEFLGENDYPPTIRDIQRRVQHLFDQRRRLQPEGARGRATDIRRNKNISRGIEIVGRTRQPAQRRLHPRYRTDCRRSPDSRPRRSRRSEVSKPSSSAPIWSRTAGAELFALRVKGHSMVDALINDGDIVLLRHQETCENGETVAVWLGARKETTLKKLLSRRRRVRLQPANVTMDPIYTRPDNVDVQGKLVSVVRSIV